MDLPFAQFIVDAWTSFARTFNPNPDPAYLSARGLSARPSGFQEWIPVTKSSISAGHSLMVLQWPSFMTAFVEQDQCTNLGFPLSYFG